MATNVGGMYQFSRDGNYFAHITSEGKLQIWNSLLNVLDQEFTPDVNLLAPCTCLQFIHLELINENKLGSPRKKKRRDLDVNLKPSLALGTKSGRLLIYSIARNELDYTIDSKTSEQVNCLSPNNDETVYAGTDNSVLVYNIQKRNLVNKWASGDMISAILALPDGKKLLTSSKSIKLWDIRSKELLKVYTGHSSQVVLLELINSGDNYTDCYFLSASKGDRLLNCWNLNEDAARKNAIAGFLMEDVVKHLSVYVSPEGLTNIAATVRSGVTHIYKHVLNGTCGKPLKPKTTVQVVTDSQGQAVTPLQITAALFKDEGTLSICYGTLAFLTFEDITICNFKKLHCLVRNNCFNKSGSKDKQVSKVQMPLVENDVHYLTAESSHISNLSNKRKGDGQQEVPMEKRLENLIIDEADNKSKVLRANNVAQLLIQGLHSKDKNILRTVFYRKDEQLIKNTIKRVPVTMIVPLLEELSRLIHGKTIARKIGITWLKHIILVHAGLLVSNQNLPKLFGEIIGTIEAGLSLQAPRHKLMGRLQILVSQMNAASAQENQNDEEILVYNDKVTTQSESDDLHFEDGSDVDDWDEEDSDAENNAVENSADDSLESD